MTDNFDAHLPPIMAREKAESILAPFRSDFCEACQYGIGRWRAMVEQEPERAVCITPRVAAGIIHCYVMRDAEPRFDNRIDEGIKIRTENESMMLIFDEVLVARFKKANADFRPSNSPTDRQFQYERQTLKLSDLPDESTNITIGYLLDKAGTNIQKITAICWRMLRLEWTIPLFDADEGQETLFGPIEPVLPPESEKRRRIRPIIVPGKVGEQEE